MAILDLATFKQYKNINSTEEDIGIQSIIDSVNAFMENYTGRVFTESERTEIFNGGVEAIYPVEHPISNVNTVKISLDNGATYSTTLVEYVDYIIDIDKIALISLGSVFEDGLKNIQVVYTGGYADIPEDLIQAGVLLVDYYRDSEYTPRKSLSGSTVDNLIQPDMTARLPPHIRRILEHYRNIVF